MFSDRRLLEALPFAVYTTDAEGIVTFFNKAAAELWGRTPELGVERWCGSSRLYWSDGRPMPHEECPMAVTLREGNPVRGVEAILERPDGVRIPFIPYPSLLRDDSGRITGAINLLAEITDSRRGALDAARLIAIVEGSDDAIVSKTLDGKITSWNAGATRIFGYEANEIVGQSIMTLIPPELHDEEKEIVAKLKRGERIEHFDTVRVTKSGERIHISLTVSPLRDWTGAIVGASKVARDVTERTRAQNLQNLLFEELNHRVKNMLATIQALASQSLLRSPNPRDFVTSFNGRVQALARAHDLLVRGQMKGASIGEIVREQVLIGSSADPRAEFSGPSVMLDARAAVHVALVLHELATNARKYGALSIPAGKLRVKWSVRTGAERKLLFEWKETGVPNVTTPAAQGFGSELIKRTLEAEGGEAVVRYDVGGVTCEITLPLREEEHGVAASSVLDQIARRISLAPAATRVTLKGKRILVVEDEPLVAMEIESELKAAGFVVVGPVATLAKAKKIIAEEAFDAALIDANLAGDPVDELAAALTQKGAPFAFATGYGKEALPQAFQSAPILVKPFSPVQLLAAVERLLANAQSSAGNVAPFNPRRL